MDIYSDDTKKMIKKAKNTKCLFLRTRDLPNTVIDDLIKKFFITDIYSDDVKKMIKKAKNTFSDYRNKYNLLPNTKN